MIGHVYAKRAVVPIVDKDHLRQKFAYLPFVAIEIDRNYHRPKRTPRTNCTRLSVSNSKGCFRKSSSWWQDSRGLYYSEHG